MRFVDTNILLYAVSALSEDAVRRVGALDLLASEDLGLSVQVLQEFYHQATRPTRTRPLTPDQALQFVERVRHFPVQDVTLEVFRTGVALSERYRLSYWDGAILAAARALGCDILYTEDLNHGQDYGGVVVVNPFVDGRDREA